VRCKAELWQTQQDVPIGLQSERNERRDAPTVGLVCLSELLVHQTFLQPKFAPQSQRRKREGENCSPFTYSHRGTYECE
jgi:hypothetical protein